MTRTEIEKTVTEYLQDTFGYDPQDNGTHLRDDIGMDSLDEVEFIMEMEKTFNIFIQDEEAYEVKTVAQIVTLIESKLPKDEQTSIPS